MWGNLPCLIVESKTRHSKIHDLDQLCAMCSSFDAKFDELAKMCNALNIYGVQPRYPDEIYVDEGLVQIALQFAKDIKDFEPLANIRCELENNAEIFF